MTLLKQYKQGQTLVTKLHYIIHVQFIVTVIKAECIPQGSMSTMYTFPDEDDDLTNYTGGNAQVMVPNGLLQGNGKLNIITTYSYLYIYIPKA